MHGCRIHYTESRYNFNDFWHNFLGVSALVKPKYAMLSENIRHVLTTDKLQTNLDW